ncbi:MAG TPA: DMT family transporter [Candidatus Obscuribacterales bacterium]
MRKSGTGWIMTALLAASIEPIIVKFGYRGNVTPLQLFALKTVFAALLFLPLAALRKCPWLGLKGIGKLAFVSLLLMGTNLFTLYALKYISAVTVITVVTTTPALVAIVNQSLGREQAEKGFWLAFWLSFSGVILSVELSQFVVNPIGLAAMFTAVVTSTVYRVRMEDLTDEFSPLTVSAYTFAIGSLLTLIFLWPFMGSVPAEAWGLGVWIGMAAGFANLAFLKALNIVGATRISIIAMLQRPLLIIAAAAVLKEPVTLLQATGIIMVLVGTQMARVRRLPKDGAVPEGNS